MINAVNNLGYIMEKLEKMFYFVINCIIIDGIMNKEVKTDDERRDGEVYRLSEKG